jgi:hypothetical protein
LCHQIGQIDGRCRLADSAFHMEDCKDGHDTVLYIRLSFPVHTVTGRWL